MRAAELGVARVLDAAAASPEKIRTAVVGSLDDDAAADRARRLAAEIDAQPGVDTTVPLLEALA